VDAHIAAHDEGTSLRRHAENKESLRDLSKEVGTVKESLIEVKVTFNLLMKFAGAGILIWCIRQIIDVAHSFMK
jgi:hypothetical protein